MFKKTSLIAAAISAVVLSNTAVARDTIEIVGSSTVYPFATVVAERLGKTTRCNTPKIESTGSGGGMKLFCKGVGVQHPDITNASRRMKKKEFDKCMKNGVYDIVEVKVGYDGIAIANSVKAPLFEMSRKDVYMALAKEIPDGEGQFKANPYTTWNEVNPALPNTKIEVLGPPPTSGTRDAFAELVMEKGGCLKVDWIKAAKKADKKNYKKTIRPRCKALREDGAYIEAGENDNLIVNKLDANPNALGIFGFSFLDQNTDMVQGSVINGVAPTFDNIAEGKYPVSRPLYFYVKRAHVGVIPCMKKYVREFTKESTWGDDGYLADRGMIPMPTEERNFFGEAARDLTPMTGEEGLK